MIGRRRPAYPRRAYRRSRRQFLLENRAFIAALGALFLCLAGVDEFLIDGYLLGLSQGVLAAFFISLVLLAHVTNTGSLNQVSGAWAEDNTRDLLRRARRRGQIFGWVDNLEIRGGDVDHLVACPSGWIAIDSKWHSGKATSALVAQDADAGSRAARRASLILRSLGHPSSVRPLIVVWGRMQRGMPEQIRAAHDVEFIAGRCLQEHLARRGHTLLDKATAQQVLKELAGFRSRVAPPDHGPATTPRRPRRGAARRSGRNAATSVRSS